jgi:hypothetical protein
MNRSLNTLKFSLFGTVVCSIVSLHFLGADFAFYDGTNPPHAVDITGKVIPPSSATQPDKPIILAKDSKDALYGEHTLEAAFDHVKHSTDAKRSIDGKSAPSCVECHHTEQPSAPKGQEYLKRFERDEVLTAKGLEASKKPVQSCRNCHFQSATEPTSEFPPQSVKYPRSMNRPSTGLLTNEIAYHVNCITCHKASQKRDAKSKAPTGCTDCHVQKQ